MKTTEDFIIRHIGAMTLQMAALQSQAVQLHDQQVATLEAVYTCFSSGQIDETGKAKLLADPLFAAYHEQREHQ